MFSELIEVFEVYTIKNVFYRFKLF